MLRFLMMLTLLAVPLGLSACDTVYMATMDKIGYAKRDILSSRVKSARDAQEDAKKDIQSTLEKFGDVESVADALFSEWETELGQYSSADLRRKSEAKLTQTRARYKEMLGAMNRAEQRIDPVLKPLRDQVLYLKHNLNARALAAMKGELVKVDAQVDRLVREMNRSIAEADKFIQAMEKEPA